MFGDQMASEELLSFKHFKHCSIECWSQRLDHRDSRRGKLNCSIFGRDKTENCLEKPGCWSWVHWKIISVKVSVRGFCESFWEVGRKVLEEVLS